MGKKATKQKKRINRIKFAPRNKVKTSSTNAFTIFKKKQTMKLSA